MYKKVKTEEEIEIFDSIWMPAWQEKGFELECLLGKVDRYLIKNNKNEFIGSVSFRPYNYDSTIDYVYPFKESNEVKENIGSIFEIENLALLKNFRGKQNLEKILIAVTDFARVNMVKRYIAVLDIYLYRTLRISYPFSMVTLSKKIYFKNTILVPVIINMEETLTNIHKYKWLNDLYHYNNS